MNRAVSHLLPCVQPVAVRAKQTQVALVRSPVTEAIIPDAGTSLIPKLLAWVDMVNIENAKVSFPTHNAGTPKLFNEGELPTPIRRVLVRCKPVFVPMIRSALGRAKAMLTFRAAPLASALPLPSRSQIALSPAVFPGAIFDPVKMGFKWFLAVAASYRNSALFHALNIISRCAKIKFDIACRRIEDSQRQMRLIG